MLRQLKPYVPSQIERLPAKGGWFGVDTEGGRSSIVAQIKRGICPAVGCDKLIDNNVK